MDTSIKAPEEQLDKKIVGWRCSADGKHFARFESKRCRYCLPIYEGDKEVTV